MSDPTPKGAAVTKPYEIPAPPFNACQGDQGNWFVLGRGMHTQCRYRDDAQRVCNACNNVFQDAYAAGAASSAAEVEVLRREVVAWRRRQDWALNVRPGESPEADSTILSSIDELLAARAATDASGALNTQKGGSDE